MGGYYVVQEVFRSCIYYTGTAAGRVKAGKEVKWYWMSWMKRPASEAGILTLDPGGNAAAPVYGYILRSMLKTRM